MKLCVIAVFCVGCAGQVEPTIDYVVEPVPVVETRESGTDSVPPVPPVPTSSTPPVPPVPTGQQDSGLAVDAGVAPSFMSEAGAAEPTCVIDGVKYMCDTSPFRVTSPVTCVLDGHQYPADAANQVGEQCSATDSPCIAVTPTCPSGWVCWTQNGSGTTIMGACQ